MLRLLWKFLFGTFSYFILLPTVFIVAPILGLFTKAAPHKKPGGYKWGSIYGTYDNPPQGDEGYVNKRSPFPGVTRGFKGYINRVMWTIRNPLYNWKRKFLVTFVEGTVVTVKGNPDISDKYKIPGKMTATAYVDSRLTAFEFYGIFPYSKKRNVRIRIGWKIKGRKFTKDGDTAALVFTFNPFDGYGNN